MKKIEYAAKAGAVLAVALAAAATAGASQWKIRFDDEAAWSKKGWQRRSLSFGNGYMGVSEFGGVAVERLQLTDPTFHTRQTHRKGGLRGNLIDAADVSIDFGHKKASGYVRELDLEDAVATVRYSSGGVAYTREFFASYPDNVAAMRFTASEKGAVSFVFKAAIPFPDAKPPYRRTGGVKSSQTSASSASVALSEKCEVYGTTLAGRFAVVADGGKVEALADGSVRVAGADAATVYFTIATNYRLVPEMFDVPGAGPEGIRSDRTPYFGPDPAPEAERRVAAAAALGWDALKKRHLDDFRALAGRSDVALEYDPADAALTTPELRLKGADSVYLQLLYWKFSKFLLASSSRPGTLPGSLQGCWAGPVSFTSWGSGFWHNINVQMDYWGAFSCNMEECFRAYAAFNAAFRPATRNAAIEYLKRVNPDGPADAPCEDFWSVGTAVWPYQASGAPGAHSGPGTGGFTTALYIDWYDFTQDREILEKECWPVLRGMADFLSRCVVHTNGLWLSAFSASPEQRRKDNGEYYHTVGCAFDQQMIRWNNEAFLECAKLLGREDDPVVRRCREQAGLYGGLETGEDGQIKEFREEKHYADFVREVHHRHISHLVGVYPAALVTSATPDLMDAARRTLDLRGEMTEAWALVHRMCCRARTREGGKFATLFDNLMKKKSSDTLWNIAHGVYLTDANYGYAGAVAEMLVQSHEKDADGNFAIDVLPALPPAWAKRGSFRGFRARGGWEVDCEWRDGRPVRVEVRDALAKRGGKARPLPSVRFDRRPWNLEEGFRNPPDSAKPHTWYHMMNGNVTKEGITCDFEALAKAGIGGVQMFDAGCAVPPGPLKFNSPEWFDMFRHAQKEAKRLGLEICIPNCSGWSSSGGPWNVPSNGMKRVVFTETKASGPRPRWSATLPREKKDHGFYEDIAVLAYPEPAAKASLDKLDNKTFAKRGDVRRTAKPAPAAAVTAKEDVIDLAAKMKPDGTLEWDVPAGKWRILRIGYVCNGRCNHPASEKGRGLEVDKLSASAMDFHFSQYVSRLCRDLGIPKGRIAETGFNNILVDSYEVDVQNWTQGFDATFEKRMDYSLRPYLPVFAGRVVGSTEESERFLEDFRRVVADLFAENYAGRLAQLCHEHGLLCSIEPYGNCPADNLQYGQDVDIPMAEFWSAAQTGDHHTSVGNSRLAATIAHVWGRRYAATESFTAAPQIGGRWETTPFTIKAQGDRAFATGINRIIYHRFTHQPWPGDKYLPGMTMGRWGMHLDRTQTWWKHAADWFRYQTRCQWMLQEGTFAADVLFWCGEEVPLGGTDTRLPPGYDFDYCATKAFMALCVENGRVVAPGGVSYALLHLPATDTMSEASLRKIAELVAAGAKVCGTKRPSRFPGLRGWNAKSCAAYARLVKNTWAKGVMECSAAEALKRLGVAPDFSCDASDVSWIHRTRPDADWYFVARNNETNVSFDVSFRQTGRTPEIWDAETGAVRDASAWRVEGGRTIVTLDFPVSGSAFVVFRRPAAGRHLVSCRTVSAAPAEAAPKTRHTLEIKKAEYGVFDGVPKPSSIDITAKVAAQVKDGEIDVIIDNGFAGKDPLFKMPKITRLEYVFDGTEKKTVLKEGCRFRLPVRDDRWMPLAAVERQADGTAVAWRKATVALAWSDGAEKTVELDPPAPVEIEGPWEVAFQPGRGAPASATFAALTPWNENAVDGIKYFSGSATYRKRIDLAPYADRIRAADRVMLDLGGVKNFAAVKVDGKPYPVLWKPPFRLDITGVVAKEVELEIEITNLWPNRIIGDDRTCAPDCEWREVPRRGGLVEYGIKELPDWVKEGKASPAGRYTFTTWRHWSKDDALLTSGLLGPVRLRFGSAAK